MPPLCPLCYSGVTVVERRKLNLDIAGLTDMGRRKEKNEDNLGIFGEDTPGLRLFKEGALLAVADGLGGHTGGEIASKLAISMVRDMLKDDPPPPDSPNVDIVLDAANIGYLPLLRRAMARANESIFQTNRDLIQSKRPMGTTLLTALVDPKWAWIGNVGDSRAYLFRDGMIIARTEDHSWVDEQVKQGLMTRNEAENDKRKNIVTRCIGTHEEAEADTYRWSLAPNDILLLCTDGLVNMVKDADITEELGQPKMAKEIAQRLVDRANTNGGKDNITVIVAVISPDPQRMAKLRRQAWLREKNITPARVLTWVAYGAVCFVAGLIAGLVIGWLL